MSGRTGASGTGRTGRGLGVGALLALCLLAWWPGAAAAQPAAASEAVIVYRTAPGPEDLQRLEQAQLRYQVLKHLPMALVRGAPEHIQAAAIGPNVRGVRANIPLDLYLEQSVPAIGATRVWTELGVTGRNVAIAVVDTGINARHPDLVSTTKVVQNLDIRIAGLETPGQGGVVVVHENVPDSDESGHGTLVASAAAGSGAAAEGRFAGVARNATLVGIGGEPMTTFWALAAFDWLLDQRERLGIRVVNASWGTGGAFDPEAPINVATRALHAAGLSVVFAAGNGGPAPNSLNAYSLAPWVISVAAARNDRALADFSSRGLKSDPLAHPTLAAPGVQVMAARDATSFIGGLAAGPADLYMAMSGTSLAASHVSGVIALMLEANDRLTPDEIKAILVTTADPMLGREEHEVGAGFVNALEAVKRAKRQP